MKEAKVTIGVRLAKHDASLLREKARRDGMPLSAWMRKLVREELHDEKRVLVLESMRELREGQHRLENHLKMAVLALLVQAGCSQEDAEEFVRRSLS
jgi:hypothetical protein